MTMAQLPLHLPGGFLHTTFESLVWLPIVAKVVLGLTVTLLLWRLVRFSILPLFRPSEPQEYPYWTPFFGHLFAFFQDSDKLLARGR